MRNYIYLRVICIMDWALWCKFSYKTVRFGLHGFGFVKTGSDRLNSHKSYFLAFLHPRPVLVRPMDPRVTRIYWLVGGFGFYAHP